MMRSGALLLSFALLMGLWPTEAQAKGDMYSQAHLKEIAKGLAKIRAAALKKVLQPSDKVKKLPDDQTYRTKEGMFFVYSVHFAIDEEKGPVYMHMVSFSMEGGYTPTPYRRTFLAYFHDLLGFDMVESFAVPADRVSKLGCMLTTKQHQKLAKKKVSAPRGKGLRSMFTGCMVQQNKSPFLRNGPTELPKGKICRF